MSVERKEFGDRGLAEYGDPVVDTYGEGSVVVQDSSAADGDCCWLRLTGTAHLTAAPEPCAGLPFGTADGNIMVHLDVERAKAVRDRLDAWIALADEGGGS